MWITRQNYSPVASIVLFCDVGTISTKRIIFVLEYGKVVPYVRTFLSQFILNHQASCCVRKGPHRFCSKILVLTNVALNYYQKSVKSGLKSNKIYVDYATKLLTCGINRPILRCWNYLYKTNHICVRIRKSCTLCKNIFFLNSFWITKPLVACEKVHTDSVQKF